MAQKGQPNSIGGDNIPIDSPPLIDPLPIHQLLASTKERNINLRVYPFSQQLSTPAEQSILNKIQMKVLIIGAGASGLPALKIALEYGLEAILMEKSMDVGGLWRYKQSPGPQEGTVMKSTVINTSKEMTAYSDFPPPPEAANYMHNRQMLAYLRSYATHFDLFPHIRFGHEVLNVKRDEKFEHTGKWRVTFRELDTEANGSAAEEGRQKEESGSGESDGEKEEIFDGIMVCTGHHHTESWPNPPFPGQDIFTGQLLHSRAFHTAKPFEDQNVVVVGIGNSGGDIAVELSKVAKQVYLSTRSGSWVLNRVWERGEPSDVVLLNRFAFGLRSITPRRVQNSVIERKLNKRFDHERFGLKPAHRFLEAHVTVNDELPNRIASGTVLIKPNVQKMAENDVIFEDGTKAVGVDTVIFATGYSFGFPHLEEGNLITVRDNRVLLYKLMFPLDLAPMNTLAIIGLIQPTGSIMPISEMQARLFCAQLTRQIRLPGKSAMMVDTLERVRRVGKEFVSRPRHTIQVQYVDYMEELAQLVGCRPRLVKYLLTDPKLASRLLFHGLVPYQYRLNGPHPWIGARKAILEMEQRMVENTRRTRTLDNPKKKRGTNDGNSAENGPNQQQQQQRAKFKSSCGIRKAIGGFI